MVEPIYFLKEVKEQQLTIQILNSLKQKRMYIGDLIK